MTNEQVQRTNDLIAAMQAQRDQALNVNVNAVAENAGLRRRIAELEAENAALKGSAQAAAAPEPEPAEEAAAS